MSTKKHCKNPSESPLVSSGPAETHFIPRAVDLRPGLYVVATPIGNLKDITLRALETLASVSLILCEDTRTSRTLLQHYGLKQPMLAYHEHNADKLRPKIIEDLQQGATIALISDAGTPLISDPGYKLIKECAEKGIYTSTLPGPCAAIAALTLGGLPTDKFIFLGFLPAKSSGRKKTLQGFQDLPATLIFYESPHRLIEMLKDAAHVLGPRPCVVARELTKLYEETIRGTLEEVAAILEARTVLGECVVLIEGAGEVQPKESAADIMAQLNQLIANGYSHKEAVAIVTESTGLPRRDIYQLALTIKP